MPEDDEALVVSLVGELSKVYNSVHLLALGNREQVDRLKDRYEGMYSLNDLGKNLVPDHLMLLSLNAFIELDSFCLSFKTISCWFDLPVPDAEQSNSLTNCVAASGLSECVASSIAAQSEAGADGWLNSANVICKPVSTTFKRPVSIDQAEPLIEKNNRLRILVDGSCCTDSQAMAEAFICLQKVSDIEVWTIFDGDLKQWMTPDYAIGKIPHKELPIYLASVDAVVLAGKTDKTRFSDYIEHGINPIIISSDCMSDLETIADFRKLKDRFPSFGSIDLLSQLCADENNLKTYTNSSKDVELTGLYFDVNEVCSLSATTLPLKEYFGSPISAHARSYYLFARYGDVDGSEYHISAKMNSRVVAELPSFNMRELSLSGWSVNTATLETCQIAVITAGHRLLPLSLYHHRPDVLKHFQFNKERNLGYVSKYYYTDIADKDLIFAIDDGMHGCVKADSTLENIDLSLNEELLAECGLKRSYSDKVRGCIETVLHKNVVAFDLGRFSQYANELEFRFRHAGKFLELHRFGLRCLENGRPKNISTEGCGFVLHLEGSDDKNAGIQIVICGEEDLDQKMECLISLKQNSSLCINELMSLPNVDRTADDANDVVPSAA